MRELTSCRVKEHSQITFVEQCSFIIHFKPILILYTKVVQYEYLEFKQSITGNSFHCRSPYL